MVTVQVKPEKMDECVSIFKEVNAPSIAARPGLDHGHWWVDRHEWQGYFGNLLGERERRGEQEHLPPENVIRYEDLVSSGGKALSIITSSANRLEEPLESRNFNPLYDREDMLRIGE